MRGKAAPGYALDKPEAEHPPKPDVRPGLLQTINSPLDFSPRRLICEL
jgi:hypothetical protein